MPQNIFRSFSGKNLWWQLVAIALTLIIVLSGFDWFYFTHVRGAIVHTISMFAVVAGGIVPVFLPFIVLLFSAVKKNIKLEMAGWAMWQAAFIGYLISIFYKTFTGRIPPNASNTILDISRRFNFGLYKEGIFWGWPSSHTTVSFALAFAVISLYPKNKYLKYIAFAYALFVGLGVSTSIHWFSEFVAGAIIGAVAGRVVGQSFKS